MSIFQTIKESLNLIDVAKYYGLEMNRSNFVSCLFHNERTPSLKLYDDHFYCYGCGKSGDVTSLIAQRFNVNQYESAKIIMNDFNLANTEFNINTIPKVKFSYSEYEKQTIRLLLEYLKYLKHFKSIYAPKNEEETLHELFTFSMKNIPTIDYYLDILHFEQHETRVTFLDEYLNELDQIEQKLYEFKRLYPKGEIKWQNKKKLQQ